MTATANGKAKFDSAATFVADTVMATSEQMLTAMKQTTTMTLDAASAMLESLGKLTPSLQEMPALPFMPAKAGMVQLVNVAFDTTENVLSMQRGLATEVVNRFVPDPGASC